MKAGLANRLWLATSRRSAQNFHRASYCVTETQSNLLQTYLNKNKHTAYLTRHINQGLPLTTYEDYIPCIERIASGEQNVLTHEPVQLFELSSGSIAPSKMIPYTRTLKSEFGRGLAAWIQDLYTHHPALVTGPAYWSISPLTDGLRHTSAGIPIGFEEDSAYLGPLGALIESALAVPNLVKHIRDIQAFRYVTLLFLLRCADLRLISVWNPTFLSLLLAPLNDWWDSLLKDIADGTITPPMPIDGKIHQALQKKLVRNKQRATYLSHIRPTDHASIWKDLTLISCWADGASESYALDLQEKFPHAIIQPKGLLATEAFVSFPLAGKANGALAVTSHYFEFLTQSGDILPAHKLEKGMTCSVIVTTGGGLYRYQLNDIVEVTDFYNQIPCVKFIGKADKVSDYFGEKLNEQFVLDVLKKLFEKHDLRPTFYMLAPDDTDTFHYTLYLELPQLTHLSDHLAIDLDLSLRQNFHYDYCRRLGQLAETQTILVRNGSAAYINACQMRGQKLGDIKPSALQKSTGWNRWFHE
jgi:hypothetical protein